MRTMWLRCLATAMIVVAIVSLTKAQDTKGRRGPIIDKLTGGYLQDLEWHPGNDDTTVAGEAGLFQPKVNPGNAFGIYGSPKELKPPIEERAKPVKPADLSNQAVFEASLVKAYKAAADPGMHQDKPLFSMYHHFLKTHPHYVRHLRELFAGLDFNRDGALDGHDLEMAVTKGYLSQLGARTVKTWDLNGSKRVSWKEFEMGPMLLLYLEAHSSILADFIAQKPGATYNATRLYHNVLSQYDQQHPAVFGLLEVSSTITTPSIVSHHQKMKVDWQRVGALLEAHAKAESMTQVQAEQKAMALALQDLGVTEEQSRELGIFSAIKSGISSVVNKVKGVFKFGKKKKDPRPKAKYGMPTYKDEICVMCQYVMQRTETALEKKVVDDYTSFDDARHAGSQMGAMDQFAQATGRGSSSYRREHRPLLDHRGNRTPTRMMRKVLEATMRQVCGDTVPYLFRAPCKKIWAKKDGLSYGLYRKLPSGANCMEAKLCGYFTYFGVKGAVHYPRKSIEYNNAPGLCGLFGGPNQRKVKASKMMCMVRKKANRFTHKLIGIMGLGGSLLHW